MARTPDSENISIANALSRLWGSALAEAVLLENELVFEQNRLQGDVLHSRFRQGNRVFFNQISSRAIASGDVSSGLCSCNEFMCLHFVAAILHFWCANKPGLKELLHERAGLNQGQNLSPGARAWLQTAERTIVPKAPAKDADRNIRKDFERDLFYILNVNTATIRLVSAKRLKNGRYSKNVRNEWSWRDVLGHNEAFGSYALYRSSGTNISQYANTEDKKIARLLFLEGLIGESGTVTLSDGNFSEIFEHLSKTQRFLATEGDYAHPISITPARDLFFHWEESEGSWSIATHFGNALAGQLLPTAPAWFFDPEQKMLGPVGNQIHPALTQLALSHAALATEDLPKVHEALVKNGTAQLFPTFPTIERTDLGQTTPTAVLVLDHQNTRDCDEVSAHVVYEYPFNKRVTPLSGDQIVFYEHSRVTTIDRDLKFENSHFRMASEVLGQPMGEDGKFILASSWQDDEHLFTAMECQTRALPVFRENGWRIEYAPGFDLILADNEGWDIEFNEIDGGWYNVFLGIEINGKKIDLVAILRDMLGNSPDLLDDVRSENDMGSWFKRIDDLHVIELPLPRIRRLARLLLEMSESTAGAPLRISRFDVNVLSDLGDDSHFVIQGGDHLRQLSETLSRPPTPLGDDETSDLLLPLRPYQLDGVAWLRSRLDINVGAVLGDEMAAGKTIQSLAHIWCEAKRNPNAAPSLVVVKMGLLSKWLDEVQKFMPHMPMGHYFGSQRHGTLEAARGNVVVLTTYQILARDFAQFAHLEWHIVACDEGHELRNPAADMTRAVAALKARQKILITGTLLQNKVEDVWAVMNIAVPGLLRDLTWFRRRFVAELRRNPEIAPERHRLIGRVTAPFRLCRKNEEVGHHLPPLNTIVRHLDMGPEQREVYETVRATMDHNIRDLIAASGLAKNQISILAAIGRLRQICCHPSLVKSERIDTNAPSVKLDHLADLAEELHEEGKYVVIFSEWVQMLDLVAKRLDQAGIPNQQLIGQMPRTKRDKVIANFRSGYSKFLLASLGTGGEGLDLPEGDIAIVIEPWWNPARINQAIARLRRDDRQKQVTALHLVTAGTLEEGVMKIGERKGEMIQAVMEGSGNAGLGTLNLDDINMLMAVSRETK